MKLHPLLIGHYKGHINESKYRDLYYIIKDIIKKIIFYNKRFEFAGSLDYYEFKYQNYIDYRTVRYRSPIILLKKFHILRLHYDAKIYLCANCGVLRKLAYFDVNSTHGACDYCNKCARSYRVKNIRGFRPSTND